MTSLDTLACKPRWGEGVLLAAAAPGVVTAAVLALVLAFGRVGWKPNPGPLLEALAWFAVSTPILTFLGIATLIGGSLAAPLLPGRPLRKWATLLIGTIAWGLATYWLSVPGLNELP